jgi:hypothetical protein
MIGGGTTPKEVGAGIASIGEPRARVRPVAAAISGGRASWMLATKRARSACDRSRVAILSNTESHGGAEETPEG